KVATRHIAGLLVATMFAVDVPIANAQRAMDSRTCAAYFGLAGSAPFRSFEIPTPMHSCFWRARTRSEKEDPRLLRRTKRFSSWQPLCESGKQWLAHSVRTSQQ